MNYPILYTFRRCPYAIRVRWSLLRVGIKVICREISLRNKPQQLLDISQKGTVPVLDIFENVIIDESVEIVNWALEKTNTLSTYGPNKNKIDFYIKTNDINFKYHLDRYKYPNRYPGVDFIQNRLDATNILLSLNESMSSNKSNSNWLIEGKESIADWCIWPFIRQFRNVDKDYFDSIEKLDSLRSWLEFHTNHDLFPVLMEKIPIWQPNSEITYFPGLIKS